MSLTHFADDDTIAELERQARRIAELEAALRDCERVMARAIYPKPDAGHDHPWSVLSRARVVLAKSN